MAGEAAARAQTGVSIVVPLFNEAGNLAALHGRIIEVARALKAGRGLATEVVYVDDGSRDATLAVARELPADGIDIQVVSLSRNFGKEAALRAGRAAGSPGARLVSGGHRPQP